MSRRETNVNDSEETSESIDLTDVDLDEIDGADPEPESVTYSGSDFDVEGLVRRFSRGDILVPSFGQSEDSFEVAGFQRRFVWTRPQMDKFIESLLLGYPIPGIFLVQQTDKRYLVLDGQQRIRTLAAFYEGLHETREYSLKFVADSFRGLTYKTLSPDLRRILDNTFIQATIVKSDGSPTSLDAVYQIFERLNSGGTQLTAHEIRVALYAGPFVEFLTELNELVSWRSLYGPRSPRIRDQEIILRFIAFYLASEEYKTPLKKFLNDFVGKHRDLESLPIEKLTNRFARVTELIKIGPGRDALRVSGSQINVALTEAVFVGLSRRLDSDEEPTPERIANAIDSLRLNSQFVDAISRATANEENVRLRLSIATGALANC